LAWDFARRDEQFRSALAARDILGQAKGIVMQGFKIDALRAFTLLTQLSQTTNKPLVDVARELTESLIEGDPQS
jgi:AmiR/NasT family two-component response regulator